MRQFIFLTDFQVTMKTLLSSVWKITLLIDSIWFFFVLCGRGMMLLILSACCLNWGISYVDGI